MHYSIDSHNILSIKCLLKGTSNCDIPFQSLSIILFWSLLYSTVELTLTIFYQSLAHFRNICKMFWLNSSYLTLTTFYWSTVHFRNIFKMFRLKTNEEIVHTWLLKYSTDQLFTSGTYLRCLDLKKKIK